ncbi:MAG TPA: hypothetical protein VMZ33_05310 [Candidatus Limnocylindrales bacterium]|nr:hypothetical protein [Candidatus Limnocylindrales bacterium]
MGHTGPVGYHALRDTFYSNAGATCRYVGVYPSPGGYSYEGELKRIFVRPPKVKGIAGYGTQKVGWLFTVERTTNTSGSWTTTYTSPWQYDMTTPSTLADFSQRSINVNVPADSNDEPPYHVYRVLVKMRWYRADGAVRGTATHRVDYYKEIYTNWPLGDGTEESSTSDYCTGWVGIEIN